MQYKVYVDPETPYTQLREYWDTLYSIIKKNENVGKGSGFIEENNGITMIGGKWGTNRPMLDDLEELSSAYPEVAFYLIQVSEVLNEHHFETLENYSLTEYKDGAMVRTSKPKPIEWQVAYEAPKNLFKW